MPVGVVSTIFLRPKEGEGANPRAVAVNERTNTTYLANKGSNNVSVINGETSEVVAVVPVGQRPCALAVNNKTGKIYVASSFDQRITIIDDQTHTRIDHFEVGHCNGLYADDTNNLLYVCNASEDALDIYNGLNARIHSVKVGKGPITVALDPTRQMAYVANGTDGTLTLIDTETFMAIDNLYIAPDLTGLAIDTVRGKAYLSSDLISALYVVDTQTRRVCGAITLPSPTSDVAVNKNTGTCYLSSSDSNEIYSVNEDNLVTIKINGVAHALAVNDKENLIFTANGGAQDCNIINGASYTLRHTTYLGTRLGAVAVNPNTERVYALSLASNLINEVRRGATSGSTRIPVGNGAWAMALNKNTNRIYTANTMSRSLTMVDGNTLEASSIDIGEGTWFVDTNPNTNRIYAITNSGRLAVINGQTSRLLALVVADLAPLVVNPTTNEIYVGSRFGDVVSVFDGTSNHLKRQMITDGSAGHTALHLDDTNGRVFALSGNRIWEVDCARGEVIHVFEVIGSPHDVAFCAASNRLYVTDTLNNLLRYYDGHRFNEQGVLEVGRQPWSLAVCENRVYVACLLGGTLSVIKDT